MALERGRPDQQGDVDADALAEDAVDLVRRWLDRAHASARAEEREHDERFRALTNDPGAVAFTMAFADRVMRPEGARVAAGQLRSLSAAAAPAYLTVVDRALLALARPASRVAPGPVMALARRRLRHLVGDLIVDRREPVLAAHLERLHTEGYAVNTNLLGEMVLGDEEAARRREATVALLRRPDVEYVSVKASAVTAQLDLWDHEGSVARVRDSLRPVFAAARATDPPTFVNLDMEDYKDLRLTLDAFTQLLDEPDLDGLEAGIVLQAYLPDSFEALQELSRWADRRHERGGAGVKVRIVKGANLAMERVDAALHGWEQAPYPTKAATDANYKRLLDWALRPDRLAALRVGVASHNLFDVAWAVLLAEARGVGDRVGLEMLHGMAPALGRIVRDDVGGLLLYTPVVAIEDFDAALAYLFRRLEENSSGENFLRHVFDLDEPEVFAEEEGRFRAAVAGRSEVATAPRRRAPRTPTDPTGPFVNEPDTDPTDDAARRAILDAIGAPPAVALDPAADAARVDAVVAEAREGAERWGRLPVDERRRLLHRAGDEIAARRAELVAVMVHEAAKTVAEADTEVSEAVDFARYYARMVPTPDALDGARFAPFGVVAVTPPWNFPVAIPIGGALAALAAGNAAIVKPAPQTPRSARAVVEACWAAGVPRDALHHLVGPEESAGSRLVAHPDVGAIVLTGASGTAELFHRLAPDTPLFAETSGKNAMVVMPDADLDLAVADLVRSAFGHAGQKCSAASLGILVGDVATSVRFRRQLADATRSLRVGPSLEPGTAMGPLIGPPGADLRRALTVLDPGQEWLVRPALLDKATHRWSPGIIDGVAPGSWFHRTECFGPVLGLVAAADLDEALAVQNGTRYGLTGGIHTLDPDAARHWLERVEVGNAYVNRAITGAVVRRQPFGGWRGSVTGPGAKAGGPNYVAQLGHWSDAGLPNRGADPSPEVAAFVDRWGSVLGDEERAELLAAVRSDAHWWVVELGREDDPSSLFCEVNVLRYRPLPGIELRVSADARPVEVARVWAAAMRCGVPAGVSLDPGHPGPPGPPGPADGASVRQEEAAAFWRRVATEAPARVRVLGSDRPDPGAIGVATYVDARPVVRNGRIELLRYLREQSVSRTAHRFGNVADGVGVAVPPE